jgi:hypothetical protein
MFTYLFDLHADQPGELDEDERISAFSDNLSGFIDEIAIPVVSILFTGCCNFLSKASGKVQDMMFNPSKNLPSEVQNLKNLPAHLHPQSLTNKVKALIEASTHPHSPNKQSNLAEYFDHHNHVADREIQLYTDQDKVHQCFTRESLRRDTEWTKRMSYSHSSPHLAR